MGGRHPPLTQNQLGSNLFSPQQLVDIFPLQTERGFDSEHRSVQHVLISSGFFFLTAELTQPVSGVIIVPAHGKRSPPTPPKRMTPVTKRHSDDPSPPNPDPKPPTTAPAPLPVPVPPAGPKGDGNEEQANAATRQTSAESPPSPPTHIPPSPPRVQSLQQPSKLPTGPTPPVKIDPPSPTTEPPSQPPAIPLHILIQRALKSPSPAQANPDGSQRAHSLLFEPPPEFLTELGGNSRHSLPVTIEPLRL